MLQDEAGRGSAHDVQQHDTQAVDLMQAQLLRTLSEIFPEKLQENLGFCGIGGCVKVASRRLTSRNWDGIALTTGRLEILFLRMLRRHRLTVPACGVMIVA
ncbi:MAG: hypothetical protein DWI22_01805 [Planctomycetota bacterium]|nr:MAG: hypothetical protein DWI22_01805 [Planctomycetota bacterium]